MEDGGNSKKYDLEQRTFEFSKRVRNFVNKLPKTLSNIEYSKQLIRSSGSVGANYIEANESLSRKDFGMRVKISRKEIKESRYWLELVEPDDNFSSERRNLVSECGELMKIFGSIIEKIK